MQTFVPPEGIRGEAGFLTQNSSHSGIAQFLIQIISPIGNQRTFGGVDRPCVSLC